MNLSIIDILLKNGSSINVCENDQHGEKALQMAIAHGNIELVKLFISYGADINGKDEKFLVKLLAGLPFTVLAIMDIILLYYIFLNKVQICFY